MALAKKGSDGTEFLLNGQLRKDRAKSDLPLNKRVKICNKLRQQYAELINTANQGRETKLLKQLAFN